MFFIVTRFNINQQGVESHSQQRFDVEKQAWKRFYNILTADIDNDDYQYELVQIIRSTDGSAIANQIFVNSPQESAEA